jgi:hypothetical protein
VTYLSQGDLKTFRTRAQALDAVFSGAEVNALLDEIDRLAKMYHDEAQERAIAQMMKEAI